MVFNVFVLSLQYKPKKVYTNANIIFWNEYVLEVFFLPFFNINLFILIGGEDLFKCFNLIYLKHFCLSYYFPEF